MERVLTISLIITAIHVCTWEGMILHTLAEWVGGVLDIFHVSVLRKPLFECIMCMGGIYTLAIYPVLYGFSWDIIPTMLCVIGLNTLIASQLTKFHDYE